jgi:hypothetical protein
MTRVLVLAALVAACGDDDPCAGTSGACVTLQVDGEVEVIDQLELDLLYGGIHSPTTTQRAGETTEPPLVIAIELELAGRAHVGVVAAGKLGGNVLGTGAAAVELEPGEHRTVEITLAPPDACTAGSFYCGGDKLAGDPQTLYQCNAGGVPLARGRCRVACTVRPGDDDACTDPAACQEGALYCGGDKLTGDPQSLYTCTGGAGTNRKVCAGGCVINPGANDSCR